MTHEARARQWRRQGGPLRWRPVCSCGWRGQRYLHRALADDAAERHAIVTAVTDIDRELSDLARRHAHSDRRHVTDSSTDRPPADE